MALQVFSEEDAERFSFDVLDSTKIIPEELVPLRKVGRMVLNRNPDNFFAETEQVAFCTAHVVPGIDFTNDPLLAGRIHSYFDTQLLRLGGPNFHEIPINAPIVPVHNNQRDGFHRQAIHRGRVSYEPNSMAGGCPFQAGGAGFVSFPEPAQGDEVRAKPEKFAEHFNQARLFYESQSEAEQRHIAAAFRFELSKVTIPAIRRRTVAMLRNASEELAAEVAKGLGMELPLAMPRALQEEVVPEVTESPALSQMARPGEGGIRSRRVAVLVADGSRAADVLAINRSLTDQGAIVRQIGPHVGELTSEEGDMIDADGSFENEPGVMYDAIAVAGGQAAARMLAADMKACEHVRDAWMHGKPLLFVGEARQVWEAASPGFPVDDDPAWIDCDAPAGAPLEAFATALSRHRNFDREVLAQPV